MTWFNSVPLENVTNVNTVAMVPLALSLRIAAALAVDRDPSHLKALDPNPHRTSSAFHHRSPNPALPSPRADPTEPAIATPRTNAQLALRDPRESPDTMVWMECLVFLAKTESMLKTLLRRPNNMPDASTAQLDLQDPLDLLEELALAACAELVDSLEFLEETEILDSLERSGPRGRKDHLARRVNPARMVKMLNTLLAWLVLKESLDLLDPKVMKAHKETRAQLAHKGPLGTEDRTGKTAKTGTTASLASQGKKGSPELMLNTVLAQRVVATLASMAALVDMAVALVDLAAVALVPDKDTDVSKKFHNRMSTMTCEFVKLFMK